MRYTIHIPLSKGESWLVDLPFLFFQSRIFRASGLTADLKLRYGFNMHLVSETIPENSIFGINTSQVDVEIQTYKFLI